MYKIRDALGNNALLKLTADGKIVIVKKKARGKPRKRNTHKKS